MTDGAAAPVSAGREPISVLIPAFNAAGTLRRALESVASQNVGALEVVVVDDGSSDETALIAETFDLLPVKLVRHPHNRGSSAALNTAIENASNDLIAFLDADDEWLPGKLEKQLALLDADPRLVLLATGFGFFATDGHLITSYGVAPFRWTGDMFWRNLLYDAVVKKSSAVTRRSLINEVGGFDSSLAVAEDQDMWIRLASIGPVGYVHELLVRYNDTPGSLMKRTRRPDIEFTLPMIERHVERLRPRLSDSERTDVLGHRYGNAARNMITAGAWGPGLKLMSKALSLGDRPGANLWYIFTNLPPVRAAKSALGLSRDPRR